jgi:hypothetical protein
VDALIAAWWLENVLTHQHCDEGAIRADAARPAGRVEPRLSASPPLVAGVLTIVPQHSMVRLLLCSIILASAIMSSP